MLTTVFQRAYICTHMLISTYIQYIYPITCLSVFGSWEAFQLSFWLPHIINVRVGWTKGIYCVTILEAKTGREIETPGTNVDSSAASGYWEVQEQRWGLYWWSEESRKWSPTRGPKSGQAILDWSRGFPFYDSPHGAGLLLSIPSFGNSGSKMSRENFFLSWSFCSCELVKKSFKQFFHLTLLDFLMKTVN